MTRPKCPYPQCGAAIDIPPQIKRGEITTCPICENSVKVIKAGDPPTLKKA